tara:strand:- start:4051 stop:4737 length:687 start_codon:yes stop_codon:yes gene_type:complete
MAEEYVISVVLEGKAAGLSQQINKAADSQTKLEQETQRANIAFLAQVARYQAMTAALNQTVGGFNKLAGAMDRLGWKEQATLIRKGTAVLELFAGPAEIYLAYLTLSIAMGRKDIATKTGQTAATGRLTLATKGLTKAMLANPMLAIAVAVTALIVVIMSLDGRVKKLTDVFWPLVSVFKELQRVTDGVIFGMEKLFNLVNEFSLDGLNKKLNDSFLGGPGAGSRGLA